MSRVSGLLRVVVIGAVLGPTFLANVFLATNTVPNITYSVVAGPVLALVVVPALVRSLADRGAPDTGLLLGRLGSLLVVASAAVAMLLFLAAPLLAWTLTAAVPGEAERADAHRITTVLLIFVAPQVVLYTVAALGAAAQQARQRFALAAAAPALENLGLILTMGGVGFWYRSGADVGDDIPFGLVVLLGAGATASVGLHAAVQVFGAVRAGFSVRPARGWRTDPAVRDCARRLRGSVAVAALPAAATYLLLALSSSVRGGVVVFSMAQSVYGVPQALGSRAVTTAVLPGLAAAADSGDHQRFARSWRESIGLTIMMSVPPFCLLVGFAGPIADLLANGELRTPSLIAGLAACIAVLGLALLPASLHEIGRQALFARLDVAGPRRAGLAAFLVTAVVGAAALLAPAGAPRLMVISGAVLAADCASAATVLVLVRRVIRPSPFLERGRTVATSLATGAMLPVIGAGWLLTAGSDDRLGRLMMLTILGLLAVAIFMLASSAVRRRLGDAT